MTTQLSPTQRDLDHAATSTDGKIIWFPDNIKGRRTHEGHEQPVQARADHAAG